MRFALSRRFPHRSGLALPLVTLLALVATWAGADGAAAGPLISRLHRTGEGVAATFAPAPLGPLSAPLDPWWRVVALPQAGPITPFEAAVYSGRGPGFFVPRPWYEGRDGVDGAGWIGPRGETTDSLFPPVTGPARDYTIVYATTFVASSSGRAFFDLAATADNAVSFFVNGAIEGTSGLTPSIAGGTPIGGEALGLSRLHVFRGFAPVVQGENTLFAVVRDRYVVNPITGLGGHGQTGLLVASVPEPSTIASLAAGLGACALLRFRGRRGVSPAGDGG